MIWSSEGERIVKRNDTVLEDPAVTEITPEGNFVRSFPIPPQLHMTDKEYGPRQNSVFEGVAPDDHDSILYVSVEEPLYQDGPRASLRDTTTFNRIIEYNLLTHEPVAEYAYHPAPVARPAFPAHAFKINGISDIMAIAPKKLLVIERSFSENMNLKKDGCTIRLFLADLRGADNIIHINSLRQHPPHHIIRKKLLLNMDSLGIYIDNVEGVTFGPDLPNGHHTLLFIVDNNFSPFQESQVLLFEVIP